MRINKRIVGSIAVLLAIGISAVCINYSSGARSQFEKSAGTQPLTPALQTGDPLVGINAGFTADASFTSHLPIVIIDTNNERPPVTTRLLAEEERYVTMEGVEPYVNGKICVIDNEGGLNSLGDEATSTHLIRLKRRGNSSMSYEKAQYLLKTVTESGQDSMTALLDMPAECEWVLNGSMVDKSMMRNYLVYRIASEFMPYSPRARYCEVIYREEGNYMYEGVYLLIESVKQGENRVDIPKYKVNDPFPSYIVRRDRFDETDIMLNTYATVNQLSSKHIGLIYPGKRSVTDRMVQYVEEDISKIERVLYSDDDSVFSTYPRYIDVDSFIDYFLLNECFGSYDAGWHSTYMYKAAGGKLKIGPVWDLDNALDNYIKEPLQIEVTAFQTSPWFDRLMRDATFLSKMEKRYAELRSGPLSDKNILQTIKAIEDHLGSAIDREWARWAHYHETTNQYSLLPYIDEDGDELQRNTNEFRQEIYRLSTAVPQHAKAIAPRLNLLQHSTVTRTGWFGRMDVVFVAALLLFIVTCFTVRR